MPQRVIWHKGGSPQNRGSMKLPLLTIRSTAATRGIATTTHTAGASAQTRMRGDLGGRLPPTVRVHLTESCGHRPGRHSPERGIDSDTTDGAVSAPADSLAQQLILRRARLCGHRPCRHSLVSRRASADHCRWKRKADMQTVWVTTRRVAGVVPGVHTYQGYAGAAQATTREGDKNCQ